MSPALAIAGVTLRALLGRKRSILMLILAGVPVLLGLLVRLDGSEITNVGDTLDELIVLTVLPLIALVFGTAALGSELDDGTAIHILARPIPRWSIVVPKLVVGGSLTAALIVPSTLLTGVLLGGTDDDTIRAILAYAVATFIGAYVYTAVFVALSVLTSRGLILGLAYTLIWEGILSGILPGTQVVSVREYLKGIVAALGPPGMPESAVGAQGFLYAAIALVLLTVLASARLARYELRGAD